MKYLGEKNTLTPSPLVCGVAVFSVLGNLAHEQGKEVKDVVTDGPGTRTRSRGRRSRTLSLMDQVLGPGAGEGGQGRCH